MPSKTRSSEYGGACDAFMEALDGFICGLISLERLRVTIATLLEGNFAPAEEMQETLDSTLREGYLDKSAYIVLSTVIDVITSEDEPTEYPRPGGNPHVIQRLHMASITPEAGDANPASDNAPEALDAGASSTEMMPEAFDVNLPADITPETDDASPAAEIMPEVGDASTPVENTPEACDASPSVKMWPEDLGVKLLADMTPETDDASGPAELAPGMTLRNRFTLLEQIGGGSMGQIFKAIDRRKEESGSTTPWVAIKSVTEALSNPPNALVALQKETANAQRLSHPNIIRVFDFDRDGDQVFMTMELLDGATLTELLNNHRFRPLPGKQARSIIEDLCYGLIYAHELGIIHADVKPGNVFVTRDGNTKLLDFGISLAANDHSQKTEVYAHTPSYASFEVLEGAEPTAQDDVYSLACVAYRILAARRAYDGATAHAAETENLELKPIEDISPGEWTALRNAMALRRTDRTIDVLSFLNEFSAKSSVSALPDTQETEETPPILPSMLFSRVARVCAALLVIVAATVALWPDRQTQDQEVAVTTAAAVPVPNNNTNPADIGPPVSLRSSEVTERPEKIAVASPVQSKPEKKAAAPIRPKPKKNPMHELSRKAEDSLNQHLLLQPAENSARFYISKMQSIDPNADEFIQARQRFADLMMLEVMVAIADEDFAAADQLIAETKSLGVASETTERYEIALAKARETKSIRETDALGSIFASTRPAAVLANPDYEQIPLARTELTPAIDPDTPNDLSLQQQSDPIAAAGTPGEVADIPDVQTADSTLEILPLSAFEFKRRVQPKYPRREADLKLAGWVELRFLVNTEGKTESIQVTDSEPKGSFEKAATKAISKWRFKPIMVDGIPAEKYGAVRLRFNP